MQSRQKPPAPRNMSVTEAAQRIGVPRKTLDNWRNMGIGPAYLKLGGRVLYPVPDLDAFEMAGRIETRDSRSSEQEGAG